MTPFHCRYRNLCILGFQGYLINNTFSIRVIAARLIEINVFSELIVELTDITGFFVSFKKYLRFVRIDLNDSERVEPGFSTTGISVLRLL